MKRKLTALLVIMLISTLGVSTVAYAESGSVKITAKQAGAMMRFTVRDNGKGIPPALMDKIFQRGVSGDDSTGLGLAICKEVVEAHGGTITADSVPGGGTTIAFTIPLYENEGGTK